MQQPLFLWMLIRLICAKSHPGWIHGYKYFCSGLRWPDATYTVNIPTCGVICFPLFKLFWRLYNSEKKTGGGFVGPDCLYLCEHIPWPRRPGHITAGHSASTPINQWYSSKYRHENPLISRRWSAWQQNTEWTILAIVAWICGGQCLSVCLPVGWSVDSRWITIKPSDIHGPQTVKTTDIYASLTYILCILTILTSHHQHQDISGLKWNVLTANAWIAITHILGIKTVNK